MPPAGFEPEIPESERAQIQASDRAATEIGRFFFSNATTCPYRIRGTLRGWGRSITDFWGWGSHRTQVRCPDDVSDHIYMNEEYQEGP
jgi:hypothetical protein